MSGKRCNILIALLLGTNAFAGEELPFPQDNSVGSIMEIFVDERSPSLASLEGCQNEEHDFTDVEPGRKSVNNEAANFLVRNNPGRYHWCFYFAILKLENPLEEQESGAEKTKNVFNTYLFLAAVGQAFLNEFKNSQYLLTASHRYQKLNEKLFRRTLDFSPRMTSKILESVRTDFVDKK